MSVSIVGKGDTARLVAVVRDALPRESGEPIPARLPGTTQQVQNVKQREQRVREAERELDAQTRRLKQMSAKLQRVQETKDYFVNMVSHELRTPLTSIRSFSEILLKHEDAEPALRREFLEIIGKESERLTRLINNVLDLAKIEAGKTELDLSDFDVRSVVADAVASTAAMAADRNIRIEQILGKGEHRGLYADRDKVQQLVMNLLANAFKFSPEGSQVEVAVEDGATPGRVLVSVRDHGVGIAKDELDRIFDRYRQVDGSSVPGTGLGLAICHEIAVLHGARIWAESEPDKGSNFCVEFPAPSEARRLLKRPAPEPRDDRRVDGRRGEPVAAGARVATSSAAAAAPALDRRRQPEVSLEDPRLSETGTLPPLAGF